MDTMDKYLGKTLDGRYEILEIIGSGGMAVVYKALCHRLNRYVAVKILRDDLAVDPEFRRRFQTESQAVAMLSHPNIVTVYDVSRSGDTEYIVMELIEGITLKQHMGRKGVLGWKEATHFTGQIAKALSHAHSRGIIHRDIKPHNIMIVKDGSVKVADFGIARLQNTQNTVTQLALGSVHYISPEQAKGEPVTAATDIYSLGVVMYEMLTGRLPFEGDSAVAVAVAHINSIPAPPRSIRHDIPVGLEAITMKAMNPDLGARYMTADELLSDIDEFRKTQNAIETSGTHPLQRKINEMNIHSGDEQYRVRKNVKPISRSGELSKEAYARNFDRSKKVSTLSGIVIIVIFLTILIVFLWNFLLKDLFSDPRRINLPDFTGSYVSDVIDNPELKTYLKFIVEYENSEEEKDLIIAQSPEKGKSLGISSAPISVTLKVSLGMEYAKIPEVTNKDFREAEAMLKEAGFKVELISVPSDAITKDYVTGTDPAQGEQYPAGSVVKIMVSSGPEAKPFDMPYLIGMSEAQARQKIESLKLVLERVSYTSDDKHAKGTVSWQNINSGEKVEEHTKIYIQVSTGPEETPTPPIAPTSPADETAGIDAAGLIGDR